MLYSAFVLMSTEGLQRVCFVLAALLMSILMGRLECQLVAFRTATLSEPLFLFALWQHSLRSVVLRMRVSSSTAQCQTLRVSPRLLAYHTHTSSFFLFLLLSKKAATSHLVAR